MASGDMETEYHTIPSEEEEEDLDNHEYLGSDLTQPFAPEGSTSKWSHQRDLDKFFKRVYQYHQRNGFLCIAIEDLSQLLHFLFMMLVMVVLSAGVSYDTLFARNMTDKYHKVTLSEVFLPISQWSIPVWLGFVLVFVACFFLYKLVKFVVNIWSFYEIRSFYLSALNIRSADLGSMTWHEVQRRLMQVQEEHNISVQKKRLTELDIYHRILRTQNYMVAFVNKEVLPLRFNVPFLGQYAYLSSLLRNIVEFMIFYWPFGGAFENSHLSAEYKRTAKRKQLAQALSKRFFYVGIILLIAFPLLWLFQLSYFCCRYAELIRRKPGELGIRRWSNYGRLYLRHFNELDHELSSRLNRAHKAATKYMSIFISPLTVILARSANFFAGTICFVILALGFIDEDVFQVGHAIQLLTVSGLVMTLTFALIPDPYTVYIPEEMLRVAVSHIQYAPDHWLGKAHTEQVRSEFGVLFQYRLVYLLEELLSPIITPLVILFCIRPRSLEVVDFLRNFSVDITSVGDVCSFAQMDVRKFGNQKEWDAVDDLMAPPKKYQTNNLKTEFSLIHFHKTNPEWRPVEPTSANFLNNLDQKEREHLVLPQMSSYPRNSGAYSLAMSVMLPSLPSMQQPAESLLNEVCPSTIQYPTVPSLPVSQPQLYGGLSSMPGPASISFSSDMAGSYVTSSGFTVPRTQQELDAGVVDLMSSDMAFSTNYLLELRHRRNRPGYLDDIRARTLWGQSENPFTLPPLGMSSSSLSQPPGLESSPPLGSLTGSSPQDPRDSTWTSGNLPFPPPSESPPQQHAPPLPQPLFGVTPDPETLADPRPSSPKTQ